MSLEIEKKYRMTSADRDRVTQALSRLGAEFVGSDIEENIIFSGEVLSEKMAVVRIRKLRDGAVLTYKRRVESDSDVKKQIEYETCVADAGETEAIIQQLGLVRHLIYEKRRDTWKFRTVEVVLDELPFGLFMEIEGLLTAIKEAEILLGLEGLEAEHETYPRLTARLGKQVGDVIESRFPRT